MLVDCKNCGAPLDASRGKPEIKCNYCGVKQFVETLAVREQVVPPGWRAPQVWQPPDNHALAGQQLAYQAASNSMRVFMFVLIVPIGLSVIGGIVSAIARSAASTPSWSPSSPSHEGNGVASDTSEKDTWSGTSTLRCSGVESHSFTGTHTPSKLELGIDAHNICSVDITNGSLHTDRGFSTSDGAKVVMHGGTLRAHEAVVARGGSHVELHDVHVIISGKAHDTTAFETSDGASLDLFNCDVEIEHGSGDAIAISASGASRVKIHGGKITGKYTIRATNGAEVVASGGAEVAGKLETENGAKIEGVRGEGKKGEAGHVHVHGKH